MKFAFAVVLSLLAGIAVAQSLTPVDPGGTSAWALIGVLASGVAIGAVAMHFLDKNPGTEQAAVAAVRADFAKVQAAMTDALAKAHTTIQALINKSEGKTPAPAASTPAPWPVAAAAVAGVSASATPAWTLGTSYASLSALLTDAAPRTTQMIRLNDAPIAGFTLPNPVDFWLWPDGSVAQTKPA